MHLGRRTSLALLAGLALGGPVLAAEPVTVAVTAIVEHPALDAARDGIKAALLAGGYEEGKDLTFTYQSAQGNPATAAQIARKLVGEAPAVIVPISTPSAQAVVGATKTIPVVFTAVTDPVAAKLVADLAHPGGNVTGMSDLSPIGKHLDLIKEITPKVKTLGVIYNPGEANSLALLELLRREAPARGITIENPPISVASVDSSPLKPNSSRTSPCRISGQSEPGSGGSCPPAAREYAGRAMCPTMMLATPASIARR